MSIYEIVSNSSSVRRLVFDSYSIGINENVLVSRGEFSTMVVGWNVPMTLVPGYMRNPEKEERAEVGLGLCTEKLLGGTQFSWVLFF